MTPLHHKVLMSPGKEILEVSTTLPRGFDDLIESKPNNLQIYYVRFVLSFITVLRKKQEGGTPSHPGGEQPPTHGVHNLPPFQSRHLHMWLCPILFQWNVQFIKIFIIKILIIIYYLFHHYHYFFSLYIYSYKLVTTELW